MYLQKCTEQENTQKPLEERELNNLQDQPGILGIETVYHKHNTGKQKK